MGDFIFYTACLRVLLMFANRGEGDGILACVTIIGLMRAINLAITKAKFKHWGIMHTMGNKLTGLALFLLLPVWILADGTVRWSIIAVGAIAGLSALEETVILLRSKTYDANRRNVAVLRNGSTFLPIQ